jgi:L-alanine-DL-glutamate epimerase-like enolase superfamily enzyme
MKITAVETWEEAVPLTRPYTIASRTISDVEMLFVRIAGENGKFGLGSASPAEEVTGEAVADCARALATDQLEWLQGQDIRELAGICRRLEKASWQRPAARVAVEMALHDLFARYLDRPLVEILGRCHEALPTSITIGIKPTFEEALAEADEYVQRGFHCLKVKIGHSLEEETALLRLLRERVGSHMQIRVDANLGYSYEETQQLGLVVDELALELVEQPVPVETFARLRELPDRYRRLVAADESLLREEHALELIQPPAACGIFNIKLMKCGGLTTALGITRLAETGGIDLMWGCMDESVISISAALHTAYACPNTRYLDLDGSFDLARDPAQGGFVLDNGFLRLESGAGLGVELRG